MGGGRWPGSLQDHGPAARRLHEATDEGFAVVVVAVPVLPPRARTVRERYGDSWRRGLGHMAHNADVVKVARSLPQTTELACFDAFLGGTAHRASAFDHLFTAEHRQLMRVAVRALRGILGQDLADRVARGLADISFDRSAPAVPDRRSPGREGRGQPIGDRADNLPNETRREASHPETPTLQSEHGSDAESDPAANHYPQ